MVLVVIEGLSVIYFIPAQFVFDAVERGMFVDQYHFNLGHFSKALEAIAVQVLAVGRVVSTTRKDPAGAGRLHVGQRFPQYPGHREFWQRLLWQHCCHL